MHSKLYKFIRSLYSSKLFIILLIFILCIIMSIFKKATYEDITGLMIIIVPMYFALNEAGKYIRTKRNTGHKKDKFMSRKFIVTNVLIITSVTYVFIDSATFDQFSTFMKIIVPAFFSTNEIEKITRITES